MLFLSKYKFTCVYVYTLPSVASASKCLCFSLSRQYQVYFRSGQRMPRNAGGATKTCPQRANAGRRTETLNVDLKSFE